MKSAADFPLVIVGRVTPTAAWVDWWNHRRLHGALDDLPPAEYEARYYHQHEAAQVYDQMRQRFAGVGLTEQRQFDLWTALVAGLSAQQTSNEPGGDRWLRLVDEAADMFANHYLPKRSNRRSLA